MEKAGPTLVRTVRLTIRPDLVQAFIDLFRNVAPEIRSMPGCRHLEIWQDQRYPNIFCTMSRWDSVEDLEAYRSSSLFKETWQVARTHFAAPPQAFSYHEFVEGIPASDNGRPRENG
jgi:heme-degrading monooxygenase HmoA